MILNASNKEHSGMELPTYDEIISTWNKKEISLTSGTYVRVPPSSVLAFCGEYHDSHVYLIPTSQLSDGDKQFTLPFTNDNQMDFLLGVIECRYEGGFIDIGFTFVDDSETAASGGFFCTPYVYYKAD